MAESRSQREARIADEQAMNGNEFEAIDKEDPDLGPNQNPPSPGNEHVPDNLNPPRHGNPQIPRNPPVPGPNPLQRPRIYTVVPLNYTKLNNRKFIRLHFMEISELYPESTPYSTRSCLGVMIIRMIANGKSG